MPLGLTDRDRQEIRAGRNREIGRRHASILFWGPLWGRVLLIAAVLAAVIYLAVLARNVVVSVWGGGLGATVSDDWPLGLLAVTFAVLLLRLGRSGSPSRRRRRRRRHRW
jgi:hypothetical protein